MNWFNFKGEISGTDYLIRIMSLLVIWFASSMFFVGLDFVLSGIGMLILYPLTLIGVASTVHKRINTLMPKSIIVGWVVYVLTLSFFGIYLAFGNKSSSKYDG
jgi:hypothetical protein